MKSWMLLVLVLPFVAGVDVDLDCPDEVYAFEEFSCEVEVEDGEGRYDLKVEVDSERDSVLRVLDGDEWKSSYYYLNDFIRDEEEVRLMIEEEGRFEFVVKLRDGEWREEFECGKIRVLEKEENLSAEYADERGVEENDSQVLEVDTDVIVLGREVEEIKDEEEWDYVSKDGVVVDWLPYLFGGFLIGLVGVLMWDRVW